MSIQIWCTLLNLVSSLMEPFFSIVFVSAFMGERFNKKQKKIFAMTVIIQFMFVLIADKVAVFSVIKFLTSQFINCTGLCLIYLKNYERIFLVKIIDMLSMVFFESVISTVLVFAFQKPMSVLLTETRYRLVGMILVLLSKCLLACGTKLYFKDTKLLRRSSAIITIILSSGILMLSLYMYSDCAKSDRVSFLQMLVFIVLSVMYILIIFSILMFDDNRNKSEELALITLHSEILHNSLGEERTTFEVWRGRLHDYKNQLIYMRELFEKEDYEKIKIIMEKEIGELKRQSMYIESGYTGIDAIVNSKLVYAHGKGIHTIYNIKVPNGLKIDDMLIASILGNLIDNAIRAAALTEEKYFEIDIVYVFENLNIKISNSAAYDKIDFEKSSKMNSEIHGIGINSVRRSVKNLHGFFEIKQHENIVDAVVKIPVERQN